MMIRTIALLALAALVLAGGSALADQMYPKNVDIAYIGTINNNVRLSYKNEHGTISSVRFNYCVALDSLPSNWDTWTQLSVEDVTTAGICQSTPRYSDYGHQIAQELAEGNHTYNVVNPLPPARYIVAVSFWDSDNAPTHHTEGQHPVLRLVTLER